MSEVMGDNDCGVEMEGGVRKMKEFVCGMLGPKLKDMESEGAREAFQKLLPNGVDNLLMNMTVDEEGGFVLAFGVMGASLKELNEGMDDAEKFEFLTTILSAMESRYTKAFLAEALSVSIQSYQDARTFENDARDLDLEKTIEAYTKVKEQIESGDLGLVNIADALRLKFV